jgi:hypothetical protein
MNKLLLSMAAVGALAAAAPAAAQYGYGSNYNSSISFSNRIAQLEARLQAGINAGVISRAEARNLRMELRQIRRLEAQYSYNGFTRAERQDLQMRLRNFRQDLRLADNNRFDRDTRYGAWNDPFWNDGYSGRGGPYEPAYDVVCENRGGIAGVVDSVLGRENCYSLRVGSRATGNLYSVPSQYRYRYRDGNGVYYRSDGRAIYEIDARTNTVLRIYDVD